MIRNLRDVTDLDLQEKEDPMKRSLASTPTVVTRMDAREGWSVAHHPRFYDVLVVTAPNGKQYTQAAEGEHATLIREFPDVPGLPPYRLIELDTSRALRGAVRGAAELEAGEELTEVKKERGRQIRARRVKAKEVVDG